MINAGMRACQQCGLRDDPYSPNESLWSRVWMIDIVGFNNAFICGNCLLDVFLLESYQKIAGRLQMWKE